MNLCSIPIVLSVRLSIKYEIKDNYYFLHYFFDVRNCISNLNVQVHDSSENEILKLKFLESRILNLILIHNVNEKMRSGSELIY